MKGNNMSVLTDRPSGKATWVLPLSRGLDVMRLQVQYYRLEEECSSPRHRLAGPVTATQRRPELLKQRVTAVGFEVRQESTVRQGHMGSWGT